MSDLECPHCGKIQQCHEQDEISSVYCTTECEYCNEAFGYSVDVTVEYSSFKTTPESEAM
jgi:hypothetical protein